MSQENKKYELLDTDTVTTSDGRVLKRVRALVAIAAIGVSAGDLGGYIESEKNLQVYGDAWVYGNARVSGDAQVYGDARVSGNAWVYGNAQVYGDARVSGNAWVYGDAWVSLRIHVGWFSIVGSEYGTLTWYRTSDGISVSRGCFSGTLGEFEEKVVKTHGSSQTAQEYRHLIDFIKLRSSNFTYEKMNEEAA